MYEPYLPEPDNAIERVRVEVYYEALCPDSKYFIIYQLLTVFEEFQNHIILDLIPYGKAETLVVDGKLQFHCQHGETECYANKIHACVIDHVNNPVKQLKYIACMIKDNMIPDVAGEKCGQEQGIDFKPISQCAKGDKGSIMTETTDLSTSASSMMETSPIYVSAVYHLISHKLPLT
ncbi:unnamed protein product [Acanthoscelides obtectus]|uniref:Gamma-interferon-inducible lysosomal thiol reductase n=1 Tax=Acanthoscelides obtectus TaxID=200917 RepID=A0A9P0KFY4_ACAOB|nr:unnamed protein product [Acanthoscelides obtectus]CAK1628128.1 GILT-like protein 1 [Acanthoscelides obtectus]